MTANKDYQVKVTGISESHSWGTIEVRAANKTQAISKARAEVRYRGHNYKYDGALSFVATEAAPLPEYSFLD
jgi:hypothetical protein